MKADEIRTALKSAFAAPEWMLAFEVRNGAGFDANRAIDALAINTWPSRGMAIHAIEIKVSRPDFIREINTPAKAEQGARYADYFWIAAPAGMIKGEELPDAWGLIEVGDKGARRSVQPSKKQATHVDRTLMVTMLRAMHGECVARINNEIAARQKIELAEIEQRVKEQVADRFSKLESGSVKLAKVAELLDEINANWMDSKEFRKRLKIAAAWNGAYDITFSRDALRRAADSIDEHMKKLGIT